MRPQSAIDLVGKTGVLFKIPSASIATYRLDQAVKRDRPVDHVHLLMTIIKPEIRDKAVAMDVLPDTRVQVSDR